MVRRSRGSLLYSPKTGEDFARYLSFIKEHVCVQNESLRVVLHRAGSFQQYPKRLNAKGVHSSRKGSKVKNIVQLMDDAFEELNAYGIEIDVRTVPQSTIFKSVYVVHDAIQETGLNEEAREYLENNTLRQVLTHFFGTDYGGGEQSLQSKERSIFIELKVPKKAFRLTSSSLNADEREYIARAVSEIDKAVPPAGGAKSGLSHVKKRFALVSFNLDALEHAKTLSEERGIKDRQYFFIAGTNLKIFGRLATLFILREINHMTSALSARIRSADWLTGIWFDPRGIKNMVKTFDHLNRGRRHLLEIYVSTYKFSEKRFRKRFEREALKSRDRRSGQLKNVRGLIFDIRKF